MNPLLRLALPILVLLGCLPPSATAQTVAPPVTLENTEVRELPSAIVGQDFRLLIARPFRPPEPPSKTYPVLYLLDGDLSFPLVRQVALSLQSGSELPPVLIVGIGYQGGLREGLMRRNRDYTPTPDPTFMKFAAKWAGGGPGSKDSGGAAKFLRFVREELKPFVEANYPADPKDATLFGDSFGGLFGAYALFAAPDTFQRYILGSPSLWWDRQVVLEHERAYAKKNKDLTAEVFIAAGGYETAEHEDRLTARLPKSMQKQMLELETSLGYRPQMVEVIEPFVASLRGRSYPNLRLTLHVFPQETHGSVPPMTISRGLRTVFGTL